MSSNYRINYHLRAHKRDAFIEFIKSLLLTPFVLRSNAGSSPDFSAESDTNLDRFCEIMSCIEDLVDDHRVHLDNNVPGKSRLAQLVPSVGKFFTPLPLKQAFIRINAQRSISTRRLVPPSFNDIRYILSYAQLQAIAPSLKLISFDGDMTLYQDGRNFEKGSVLGGLMVGLLGFGLTVAIVTAAGYGEDNLRYEERLQGLISDILESKELSDDQRSRFYVMGGECNFLFQLDPGSQHLSYIEPEVYITPSAHTWSLDLSRISLMLDVAQTFLKKSADRLGISQRIQIIRKAKAVGLICPSGGLSREQLDELALGVQEALRNHGDTIPFCAFNGGSDVWCDVGNKQIGVGMLQEFLQCEGNQTLHVGDQFLSTGNDLLTRSACATVWITGPEETAELLGELERLLKEDVAE